jgi:hypothetical protein
MSKRVLVMTGFTDSIKGVLDPKHEDSPMEDLYELTLPSKEKYARRHGYDFLSIRNFGCDQKNKLNVQLGNPQFQVGKLRAYRAFRLLNEYDVVMWLDADSIVTNIEYGIDHFGINDSQSFYASYDWEWKNSFSTGNFILNKTEGSQQLFNVFYDSADKFPEEQSAMNRIYKENPMNMRKEICILDHEYLGAVPNISMYTSVGAWGKERRPPPYPWKSGDFLLHVTGSLNSQRIAILTTYFKEYLS